MLQNSGSPDVNVALTVGQVVETFYTTVGGVGHVWVSGRGAYDMSTWSLTSHRAGRSLNAGEQRSRYSRPTGEYWGSMNVEPMGEGELYLNNICTPGQVRARCGRDQARLGQHGVSESVCHRSGESSSSGRAHVRLRRVHRLRAT